MKLIDKDALVAEIERRKSQLIEHGNTFSDKWACGSLDTILSFIDTLEEKEVDFEKELVAYHNENLVECNDGTLLSEETGEELTWYDYKDIARHFFEFGLKAQKGE